MLEREFQFYETNKTAIREKYLGKQIVIVGDQIIASYDDIDEAYQETIKAYTPGTFMIHDVPVDIEDEIVHLNTSLSLSTDALWDTGASMSAITPEIQNKLKVTPVDKKTIAGPINFF